MEHFIESLLAGSLRNLSHTYRFDTLRQIRSENVAEHSFYASAYALALYLRLESWNKDVAKQIDLGQLLAQAICHDMEERLTGDVTRCFKELVGNQHDCQANKISKQTFQEECLPLPLAEYQAHGLDSATLEGRLVRLADLLCVCAKLLEEAELGNQYATKRTLARMVPQLDHVLESIDPADPLQPFTQTVLLATRKTLSLRCSQDVPTKNMHTGY